jgi:hypothetical protein
MTSRSVIVAAVGRSHLVVPRVGPVRRSTRECCRACGRRIVVIGARGGGGRPRSPVCGRWDRVVAVRLCGFDLLLAQAIGVRTSLARSHLDTLLPVGDSEALSFDPYHQGGGQTPVGVLNAAAGVPTRQADALDPPVMSAAPTRIAGSPTEAAR